MSVSKEIKTPWKDGIWYSSSVRNFYIIVKGNEAKWMKTTSLDFPEAKPHVIASWNYGEFGNAKPEVIQASGKEKYNLEIKTEFMTSYAVVDDSGLKLYMIEFGSSKLNTWKCLTDQELQAIKDSREPFDSPSNPYVTPKPGQLGKLLWLSGPPGAGKSTSAALLGRDHGFVYYEGDCIFTWVNPYIDPRSEEPTMEDYKQVPLKGLSYEEIVMTDEATASFMKMWQGTFEGIEEQMEPFLKLMANHIANERQRLGGDFAVAQAIFSHKQRSLLREIIGPDLVFIVMNMTKESQMKRLEKRHGDDMDNSFMEVLFKYADMCEPAREDEINAFNVNITEDMSKEDVVKRILEISDRINQA